MGLWTLFKVASMPILQVLIVTSLGAFMATEYCNVLTADARRSVNKILFLVFTPSLMFANLAKSVTLEDIISWWFMPINIGLIFLIGGILGWILVKILKPKPHLEGLVISICSAGNLGGLLLIIIPAVCDEEGSPFGNSSTCSSVGRSYASFSMALCGLYIWTFAYQMMRTSAAKKKATEAADEISKAPVVDLEATQETHLLQGYEDQQHSDITLSSAKSSDDDDDDAESQTIVSQELVSGKEKESSWTKLLGGLHNIVEVLLAPPTLGALAGFIFGATTFLRNLIIGDDAPLKVIEDSIKLLSDAAIPCIILVLGGNLTQGLRSSKISAWLVIGVICVRYVAVPAIGMWIVIAAGKLGFLPSDTLFHYVLMIQYTLPPAMNLGTMAQLFDLGQEECSVLLLWTYLAAAIALTFWSTIFMWILS